MEMLEWYRMTTSMLLASMMISMLVLNVDSVTNLITYVGVVEPQEINTNPDETTSSDSLYIRAKRWAVRRFTGGNKALFDVDKKDVQSLD